MTIPTGLLDARSLRLWHWRECKRLRASAQRYREQESVYVNHKAERSHWRRQARNYDRIADFHIKAVQVLNDCPGCLGTTAEQDMAVQDGRR